MTTTANRWNIETMIPIRKFYFGLNGQRRPGRVNGKENPIMAKLALRGASAAKGAAKGKSGAKAARKKGGRKGGGSRRGRANGGIPYSGQTGGSSGSDASFDFGANDSF